MYVSTKSRRLGCSSFFRRLYRARSQGLTTSARSKRWMRVATAEKPDGLFLQPRYISIKSSRTAATSPAFSRTKIVLSTRQSDMKGPAPPQQQYSTTIDQVQDEKSNIGNHTGTVCRTEFFKIQRFLPHTRVIEIQEEVLPKFCILIFFFVFSAILTVLSDRLQYS